MNDNDKRAILVMIAVFNKYLDALDITIEGINTDPQRMQALSLKRQLMSELEESRKVAEKLAKEAKNEQKSPTG